MRPTIRKLALQNAVKYNGTANPKAIVGAVIKEFPEARKDMRTTMETIDEEVEVVNDLDFEEQKKALLALHPEYFSQEKVKKDKRKVERKNLPPLKNAIEGKVVTRIPPEPSKYPHVGHALSFLINYLYAEMYSGRCILRFDDTNPEKGKQEYVDAIYDDVLGYLGVEPSQTIFASDHMTWYYEFAGELIDKEHAYVCNCPQETMSVMRRDILECEHRSRSSSENKTLWVSMLTGGRTDSVLRLKIDMAHKNAVMRDPAIFRVSLSPHYRTGEKYKVWPLYDFESAVEEGLNKITHVMRSNEFASRIELQQYIHSLLELPTAEYKQYGRYQITGASTQGREIREQIESGEYIGWDDPRLVTLKTLKRRGIVKESLYELAGVVGMSKQATTIDYSVIASINRRILDRTAKRFFLIEDPVTITFDNLPTLPHFTLPYHPDDETPDRVLEYSQNFIVEKKDWENFSEGTIHRFMDAFNFTKKGDKFLFHSTEYEAYRSAKNKGLIVHYIPTGSEFSAKMMMDTAQVIDVLVEKNVSVLAEGDVVQFERWGFARLDKQGEVPVFWFSHE